MSATNVVRAGKRGNICVGNNVSATVCPRLPGPLARFVLRSDVMLGAQAFNIASKMADVLIVLVRSFLLLQSD